jgi:hypothetical protein
MLFRHSPAHSYFIHDRQSQAAFLVRSSAQADIGVKEGDLAIITGTTENQVIVCPSTAEPGRHRGQLPLIDASRR